MEYQKVTNFLDNPPNQSSKFRTKNWIEINDQSRGAYNTNSHIRLLKSSLFKIEEYIKSLRLWNNNTNNIK